MAAPATMLPMAAQVLECHVSAAQCVEPRIGLRIVFKHSATEASYDPRHTQADPSCPDDADGANVKIEAKRPIERKVAFPDPNECLVDLAVEAQISAAVCSATASGE